MRYLILSIAVFMAFGLAVWLIGMLLPATREGRAQISIAAPPEAILATIRAVDAQPEWRGDVARVTRTAEGWVETTTGGEEITFIPEMMTKDVIRLRFASDAGFRGIWQAKLTANGASTHIAVVETVNISSPIGRILARLLFDPQQFATKYLLDLKTKVEAK